MKSRTKRKSIKYPVNTNDLSGFLKEGGTIFFVVYFDSNGNNVRIYYKSLLPYDLIPLIDKNADQKSCSIKFKPFPDDPSEITDILNFFAKHKEMQSGIKNKTQLVSFEDLSKIGAITKLDIPISSQNPINNPILYLLNHEAYVYALTPYGFPIPVDYFERITIAQSTQNINISIDGVEYYNNWQIQYEENCSRYLIGKSISITRINNDNQMTFNFKFRGTLSERISDGEFLLHLMKQKGFSANGKLLPFNPLDSEDFNWETFRQKVDALIEARNALHFHDVTEELNMDILSESDYDMLNLLIDAYKGNEVCLADIGQPFGFITIGNLQIIICTTHNEATGRYRIHNFYETDNRMFVKDQQEVMHVLPLIMGLKEEDLLKCSNLNMEKILKEFSKIQYTPIVSEYVTSWLLEFINAYDSSDRCKKHLLDAAQSIVESIRRNDKYIDRFTLRLNELQIFKRKRNLNVGEKSELFGIISNSSDNIEIRIGAYILLDEIEEASKLLISLSEERQKNFMRYPIYALAKMNNC